jgi:hypothetical protein
MIRVEGVDGEGKTLLTRLLADLPQPTNDVLVSWGTSGPRFHLNGQPRVDGLEQLRRFREGGLLVPEFTTDPREAMGWVRDTDSLVFGRNFLHTQGRDIVGPGRRAKSHGRFYRPWLQKQFWVKVIPDVIEEWRIHVFKGKSIARGLKHLVETPRRAMPVRNRENGWYIRHDIDPPKGVRPLAKIAVELCGYDFGAVDILVTNKDNNTATTVYVLEVNKAPGIDLYTASAYASAISQFSLIV